MSRFCERTPANHTSVSRFCERTPARCRRCCPLGQSARRRNTSLTRCPPPPCRLEDVKFRLWLAGLATLQFCLVFLNTFTNVRAARCAAVPLRMPALNKMNTNIDKLTKCCVCQGFLIFLPFSSIAIVIVFVAIFCKWKKGIYAFILASFVLFVSLLHPSYHLVYLQP